MKAITNQMQEKLYHTSPKKQNNSCANCGFHGQKTYTFESMLSGQFQNANNGTFSAIRSTPVRAATIEADVLVPAAQSLIWSIATMLPSVSVALFMRWEWSAPIFVGATTVLISWIVAMKKSEFTMNKTEEFSYEPSEATGVVGNPTKNTEAIRMEVVHKISGIRRSMQLLSLPENISDSTFSGWVADVVGGASIARRMWVGPDKIFSRDDYDGMMSQLEMAGIVSRSANGARVLSPNGRRTLAGIQTGAGM